MFEYFINKSVPKKKSFVFIKCVSSCYKMCVTFKTQALKQKSLYKHRLINDFDSLNKVWEWRQQQPLFWNWPWWDWNPKLNHYMFASVYTTHCMFIRDAAFGRRPLFSHIATCKFNAGSYQSSSTWSGSTESSWPAVCGHLLCSTVCSIKHLGQGLLL